MELDGSSHPFKKCLEDERQDWLTAQGWTVQHISNELVMEHIEFVLHVLEVATGSQDPRDVEDIDVFESYSRNV